MIRTGRADAEKTRRAKVRTAPVFWLVVLMCLCLPLMAVHPAVAHDSGLVPVNLRLSGGTPVSASAELDLVSLQWLLALDADQDGRVLWREYQARQATIRDYVISHFSVSTDTGICKAVPDTSGSGIRETREPRVVIGLILSCPRGERVAVVNRLFQELDPNARVLLTMEGGPTQNMISLSVGETDISGYVSHTRPAWVSFIGQGILHILGGHDHLAFLLLLLLPVARSGAVRTRVLAVTGIITAFTLAHSLTLLLSTRGWLVFPQAAAEILIAASVTLAALVNLLAPGHRIGWGIAYAFGLIHGFGFAGALAELDGSGRTGLLELLGFNLGVEGGQLLVMGLVLPVLARLGSKRQYRRFVVPGCSVVLAGMGLFWTGTRLYALV